MIKPVSTNIKAKLRQAAVHILSNWYYHTYWIELVCLCMRALILHLFSDKPCLKSSVKVTTWFNFQGVGYNHKQHKTYPTEPLW